MALHGALADLGMRAHRLHGTVPAFLAHDGQALDEPAQRGVSGRTFDLPVEFAGDVQEVSIGPVIISGERVDERDLWGEAIALCVRNLTLAYVVIYPSLARISAEYDRAARVSGAGWWTIARRVLLPILRPALLAAFVLMFIVLLSDYDSVVFLQKPGTELLGVTMLQYWARGVVGPVAALAVVQVVIVGVVLLLGARALRRSGHA